MISLKLLLWTKIAVVDLVIASNVFPAHSRHDEKLKVAQVASLLTSCLCSVPDPPRLRDIPDLFLLCLPPHPNTTSARPNANPASLCNII